MAPTNISHRQTHNLLLISKLLSLRDTASPFTLLLDCLEQPATPLIKEYIRRAKVSRCYCFFFFFFFFLSSNCLLTGSIALEGPCDSDRFRNIQTTRRYRCFCLNSSEKSFRYCEGGRRCLPGDPLLDRCLAT